MYLFLIGPTRSSTSSQINTFNTRFAHFFKKISATSSIARLSSTLLYWSTPDCQVVDGAISDVIRSNCFIQIFSSSATIFSVSKILS
ncbi:TPA: hypothetical protein DEG21_02880 [Patescibacteria group bacterium]|nr:hypothetical protein [Candidatus Gracilibacteria bacterium]HBY74815.1 hypothetical protein [Candidatus Gracilibacteria bacterium]